MAFYFFTESSKLASSTNKKFGLIDDNEFRLCDLFSATLAPKAFAVSGGNILIQEVTGNSNLVNLIIKPSEQPDLNLPKIQYIIYKSLIKSSIIGSTGVIAPSENNDLTRKIWESHALQVAAFADNPNITPPTNPLATDILGLGYSSAGSGDDLALDSDSLDKAFYSNSRTLFPITAGDYIGDFNLTDFGLMIVFEKIGFRPTFKLARETESKLTFATISPTASNAAKFKRKHEKEQLLAFMDPCAFFGAFHELGIETFTDNGFAPVSKQDLYNNITSKYLNKNKIYLDIRNEYGDSLNYYENYSNTIKLSLENTDTFTPINYYRNSWPILVIDNSEVASLNVNKTIKIALPVREDQQPLIYLKRAYLEGGGLDKLLQGKEKFLEIDKEDIEDGLAKLPKNLGISNIDNLITANYFQIRLLANNNIEANSNQFLSKRYYLDNLFPIFDLNIPFNQDAGKTTFKLFYDTGYTDKLLINAASYSHSIGIAKDNNYITFISLPFTYNFNVRNNADDTIPLGGMEAVSDKPFLSQITDLVKVVKLMKLKFLINGEEKEYLKFIVNEDVTTVGEIASNYTFEDVTVFALTIQQFSDIKIIKEQEFTDEYKVYMGITDVQVGVDDTNTSYTKFSLVLNGIKEQEGEIIAHNVLVGIEIYTDQKIIGVNYQRNYEEAVGYDSYYDYPVNQIRYEDYFISLAQVGMINPIKAIVDAFEKSLIAVNTSLPSAYAKIQSIVKQSSSNLWITAKNHVQGNPNAPDDRPLYWARIKMLVALKSHIYFRGDVVNVPGSSGSIIAETSQLAETIILFEEGSRNYKGINFSAAGSKKKILITGFDPFGLEIITQWNPSGMAALAIHDQTITGTKSGLIQSMIFPVRFKDFDDGVVEKYIFSYLSSVDMIITVSQGRNRFDIERFASKLRGTSFHDNLGIVWQEPVYYEIFEDKIKVVDKDSISEFLSTTLPKEFMVPESLGNIKVVYNQGFVGSLTNAPYSSEGSGTTDIAPPSLSETAIEGSGGSFLSNEIFYRVSVIRKQTDQNKKTGHLHAPILVINNYEDAENFITEIKTILKDAIQAL